MEYRWKRSLKGTFFIFVLSILAFNLFLSVGVYSKHGGEDFARVAFVDGPVKAKEAGTEEWISLAEGRELYGGDEIITERGGTVELLLPDDSVLKIGQKSHVKITEVGLVEVTKLATNSFELVYGKIRAVVAPLVKKKSSFTIETENALIGVRGTNFGVSHDEKKQETEVACLDGEVELRSKDIVGSGILPIIVGAEEGISLVAGRIPGKPVKWAEDQRRKFFEGMDFRGKEILDILGDVRGSVDFDGDRVKDGIKDSIDKINPGGGKILDGIKDRFK